MVLHRRLDYGFAGHEAPVVPRASRSPRVRVPLKKKREDNPIHAFEILATVAGELLQDTKSSGCEAAYGENQNNIFGSTVEWKQENEGKLLKTDRREQETCEETTFAYMPGLQGHHQSYAVNEFSHDLESCSFKNSSNQSEKILFADKWAYADDRNASEGYPGIIGGESPHAEDLIRGHVARVIETRSEAELPNTGPSGEVSGCALQYIDFFGGQVDCVTERKCEAEPSSIQTIKSRIPPSEGSLDSMELDGRPPALISPESNVRASLFRRSANLEIDSRDDDENSVGCIQPDTMKTTYRPGPLPNMVDQRIKNLSACRHWRVAPKLKGGAYFKTDWKKKSVYHNGRPCYTRQGSQRISPFKRRKLFDRSPISKTDGKFQGRGVFNSPDKRSNADNCAAASYSVAGQRSPSVSKSRDYNVKLSIKSFKVPELVIEIPATATVGSLKRTVMEAVTAILGDGLHVGILLQGKTVRDDNKTLLQTGICHDDKHHCLGFMLEPKHAHIMPPTCTEDCPSLSNGTPRSLIEHALPLTLQPGPSDISPLPQVMNPGSCVDNNLDAARSPVDISSDNAMPTSRALVAVPAIAMEALAVVPFNRKSPMQRRIRRPFSVSEVEALVEAVEKLGTGRWRDVKLRAFDNAKHRTYVDLKDKWKTLVHTARISPQQRRGAPVPQQLLDRVLAAHAYWSEQQARQQVKVAV